MKYLPLLVLLAGFASAQADVPGFDTSSLRVLGSSFWTLGLTVFSAVASLKRSVEIHGTPRKVPSAFWKLVAFTVGLLAAVVLNFSGFGARLPLFGQTGAWAVLFYGLAAGLVAMLGRDALKTVISWFTIGFATAQATIRPAAEVATIQPLLTDTAQEILPPAGVIQMDPTRTA